MRLYHLGVLTALFTSVLALGQSTPALEHIHVNGDTYPSGWGSWGLITHQLQVTVTSSSNNPVSKADDTFNELVSELSTGYVGGRAIYLENFGSIAGGTDTSFLATSTSESGVLDAPGSGDPNFSNPSTDGPIWRPRHPWFAKPLTDDDGAWSTSTKSAKKWMRLYLSRLKDDIDGYNSTHTPHVKYPDRWTFDWEDQLLAPTDRNQLVNLYLVAHDSRWSSQDVPGFGSGVTAADLYDEAASYWNSNQYSPVASDVFCSSDPTSSSTTGLQTGTNDRPYSRINQHYFLWYHSLMLRAAEAAWRKVVDDQIASTFGDVDPKIMRFGSLAMDGRDDNRSQWTRQWLNNDSNRSLSDSNDFGPTGTLIRGLFDPFTGGALSNLLYAEGSTQHAGDWATNGRWLVSTASTPDTTAFHGSIGWPAGTHQRLGPALFGADFMYPNYADHQKDYYRVDPGTACSTLQPRTQDYWGAAMEMHRQVLEAQIDSTALNGVWTEGLGSNPMDPNDIRITPWMWGPNLDDGVTLARTRDLFALLREKRIKEVVFRNLDPSLWGALRAIKEQTYQPFITCKDIIFGNSDCCSGDCAAGCDPTPLEDTLRGPGSGSTGRSGPHDYIVCTRSEDDTALGNVAGIMVDVVNLDFSVSGVNTGDGIRIDLVQSWRGVHDYTNDVTCRMYLWNWTNSDYDEIEPAVDSSCYLGFAYYAPQYPYEVDNSYSHRYKTRRTFVIDYLNPDDYLSPPGDHLPDRPTLRFFVLHHRPQTDLFDVFHDLVQIVRYEATELVGIEENRPMQAGGEGESAPPCDQCATISRRSVGGDYNMNGVADGDDVSAYYSDWVDGRRRADFNHDGVVDATDMELFTRSWMGMQ